MDKYKCKFCKGTVLTIGTHLCGVDGRRVNNKEDAFTVLPETGESLCRWCFNSVATCVSSPVFKEDSYGGDGVESCPEHYPSNGPKWDLMGAQNNVK